MVTVGEKVSSPSSHARKDLVFFKVFLPEFSSHQVVIPPAFIDIIEKPLPNEVLFIDEIGRLWCVETEAEETEERSCVLFKKGWRNFVNDQSLEFGDFLVFDYDGHSRFSVTIFAKDGCKKDLGVVTTTDDRSRVLLEKEPIVKPVEKEQVFKPVEKEPVVKPVEKEPVVKLAQEKPDRRIGCETRVKRKRRRVSVKEEEPSVLVKDEPEYISTSKTEPEHRVNTRRNVNRPRGTCDISWVPDKKPKGVEEPVYKPKNPHFVRTITKFSLTRLEIPQTLLKLNGIELEDDLELCDENGTKWPLKIATFDRGVKFAHASWLCFSKGHKLMSTNKCLFEFIVGSNGKCNKIQVRIFRGRLPTTITRNGYHVVAM